MWADISVSKTEAVLEGLVLLISGVTPTGRLSLLERFVVLAGFHSSFDGEGSLESLVLNTLEPER